MMHKIAVLEYKVTITNMMHKIAVLEYKVTITSHKAFYLFTVAGNGF